MKDRIISILKGHGTFIGNKWCFKFVDLKEGCKEIESLLSTPTDAERGKDADARAMNLIRKYQQGDDDWLRRKQHVVSVFMTEFAASETARLREELDKVNKERHVLLSKITNDAERWEVQEDHIRSIKSELSAANQRIAELEEQKDVIRQMLLDEDLEHIAESI